MVGIYKITNPKGKIYIGQSVNIKKRLTDYKYPTKKQTKIFNSIIKYGYESHVFEIVEECTIALLNKRERYWQEFYNVLIDGLNCRLTETSDKSGFFSEESKKKISKSKKGHTPLFKNNELRSKRIADSLTGKKLSASHRRSLSIGQTGLRRSEEAIRKSLESRKGRKDTKDTKKKKSENQMGCNNSFAKKMLNLETGIYYDTAKEAAYSLGWSYERFSHYINGRTKRKLPFIFI